jgi:hypothetical protein
MSRSDASLVMLRSAVVALVLAGLVGTAAAQSAQSMPPKNAQKLSALLGKVEQRPDFAFVSEVQWDEGGYEITYYTTDNAKVELKFDPVSGNTVSLR